jgi:hypothetical protein
VLASQYPLTLYHITKMLEPLLAMRKGAGAWCRVCTPTLYFYRVVKNYSPKKSTISLRIDYVNIYTHKSHNFSIGFCPARMESLSVGLCHSKPKKSVATAIVPEGIIISVVLYGSSCIFL